MEKREGVKGRRPEFCSSCSKSMMSYITTVRDFLDKVVEDIDMNTPSSRREEGVLARTRIATEASARDSSQGRRRISQSSAQSHQTFTSTINPTANQASVKGSTTTREEKYKSSAKFTLGNKETPFEHYQNEAVNHDVQPSKIVSPMPLKPSHIRKPHDTRPSNLSHEQSSEPSTKFPPTDLSSIDQSSSHSKPVSSTIDDTSSSPSVEHSADEQSFVDLLSNKEPIDRSSGDEPVNPHLDDSPRIASESNETTSSVQEVQSKPLTSYKHPPPLYSDHLSPPAPPEQAPLPIEEPSLPDGPFPSTWVEDMIRVCDIPLLLPPNEEYEAYVTMATNNLTAIGCLVLGNSLRLSGTNRTLVVLITDDITEELRNLLASVFHLVQPIGSLEPTGSTKLALLEQPELGINYSKLLVWRLNQFDKCVYLSPDTLVIQNCDELFQRQEVSAVPDIGWPDFFNAGVFVYVPSDVTFWDLVNFAENKGSFDGGDQGLLNFYFRSWALDINKRLPFIYNLMANVSYTYGPAFVRFGGNAKIVHFFGATKPWNVQFNVRTGQLAPYSGVHPTFSKYVQYWLTIFAQCVLPLFSPDIQKYTTMHGYVNAVDLARIVTGQAESAMFSPPSFRRYLDVPESVAFPAEKVQSTVLRCLSVDEGHPSEEEEEEEVIEEDKEAEVLADLNRMQAWEQGRIDYLGQDSSDRIMKRLDRFIRKGNRL